MRATGDLDIIIDYKLSFIDVYKNRKVFKNGDTKIFDMAVADLIKMKKQAGRERDKIDIKALKRVQEIENGKKKA